MPALPPARPPAGARSVGWHLALFAAALALPMLAFAGLLLSQVAAAERTRLESQAVEGARAAAVAVDRELAGLVAALDVLALSRALRAGDLGAFHAEASEMQERLGVAVVMRDRAGQQILDTRVPWGTPLPLSNLPEPDPSVWRTSRPFVSDLFSGAVARQQHFAVLRAVTTNAGETHLLSLSLPATRARELLLQQAPPEGWTLALVDGAGRILARSQRHEEFVGREATRDLLENTRGMAGSWRGATLDGTPVLGTYARSQLAGWRVAVGIPVATLDRPLRRSLWLLAGTGALLTGLSAALAFAFGRRITAPLVELAHRAASMARGEQVAPVATRLREAAVVGGTLAAASRLLRAREAELRQFNAALEARVAERTRDLEAANARLRAEAAERERAEAQLRQAQKMEAVGRLTGGVAHDFNNLLTVVIGNLAMARRRLEEGNAVRVLAALDGASEGARRAAELTARLLAFSRQQPLAPEPVNVNRLVGGMSDLLGRTLGEDVHVETVLGGGLWRAQADPNQLEAAILNLAVNARDAMPGGGKLTIETANAHLDEAYAAAREEVRPGQYVMISVTDTGTGMPPEIASRAFEPFFTTKPVGKGTGLGLSQVYGFARQSGGHVAIYSEPGQGTTVRIYLPRLQNERAPEAQPARPAPSAAATPSGRGETILVVEDEEMVRDFAVAALMEAGYRVLAAEDGPRALALLEAHPEVSALFTDVVLTGPMNGREVADAARALRPGIVVLFTTGYTRNAIIHQGRLDEGVEFIGKPYGAAALDARLRRLLDAAGG